MLELIKLIEEYGELEKKFGYELALNENGLNNNMYDLMNKRSKKFTELMNYIIGLNVEFLLVEDEEDIEEY